MDSLAANHLPHNRVWTAWLPSWLTRTPFITFSLSAYLEASLPHPQALIGSEHGPAHQGGGVSAELAPLELRTRR